MTDYDADEIVPQRKRLQRASITDKTLGATGILLAAMAVFFPWYAFMHQDRFAMPALWQGSARDLPADAGKGGAASPLAMLDKDKDAETVIDQLVTATVPSSAAVKKPADDNAEQPFPAATGFKLMYVSDGRALIEDKSGMYIVRVGSALPDNSRLSTLEQRDGRWVMITSKGDVLQAD